MNKSFKFFEDLCFTNIIIYDIISFVICPWLSWIARQTPTLKVEGSNPFGQAKKSTCFNKSIFLSKLQAWYGITLCVYGIAEGVWHHRRCILLRLDSIPSCDGFHTMLCIDSIHAFGVINNTRAQIHLLKSQNIFCPTLTEKRQTSSEICRFSVILAFAK